jgi:nitroimidazol reductase NimA-like FMN-containing flavoprotein (pyridoxamine 5'-phosphate oxidase superfamily)
VTPPPPRSAAERKQHALERLEREEDAWVASASADGLPHLIPLSYRWDGSTLLLSTPASSLTTRNLLAAGRVQLALDGTRDVILVHGTVEAVAPAELSREEGDAFAAHTGFDPRTLSTPYAYLRVAPRRILAWREVDELDGRELMRAGRWLV